MARRVRVFQVDAFTALRHGGNPAAVVLDAERLDEQEMQALARELRGGDSAFVFPADADDHDVRVRFFTPRAEVSFVGHATIAVLAVRAALGLAPAQRQKQRNGIVATGCSGTAGNRSYFFSLTPPPLRAAPAAAALDSVLAAFALDRSDLDAQCPATVAGENGSRLLLAARDGHVLARLRPDLAQLSELSRGGCPPGYFIYTRFPAETGCDTEARMFCPAIGIDEDPVSGNAHALLAAYLDTLGVLPGRPGDRAFTGKQGHHMGRPGEVRVTLGPSGSPHGPVRIEGHAAIAFEATIDF